MFFKLIADTFSVARNSDHFIQLKSLKKPGSEDQLWAAIEIIGDSKYARSTTQSILDTLEEVYFDQPENSSYERFETALKEVNIIAESLREKRGSGFGQVNAIIAAFSGQELHITQSGDGEAYLIRRGKFSMISEGLSGKSDDLFVNIASGDLLSDDKLIFSTGRILRLATHSQIVHVFNDGVAEAVESLKELTLGDEEMSIGLICVHSKLITKPGMPTGGRRSGVLMDMARSLFSFVASRLPNRPSLPGGGNRKNILFALLAVILILAISVSVLMDSKRNKAIREEYRTRIEKLNADLHTANTKGYANDKETANIILEKVDKEARDILDSGYFRAETLDLLDKIQDSKDSINNTDRLKGLIPYVDLAAKKTDVKAVGLVSLDEKLYAYEYNTLHEIILDRALDPKKIDDTEIVVEGAAMEDQNTLAFLTQSGRVIEYADGQTSFATTEDQVWSSGVDIEAYGRYIYILSPAKNQIYKYARNRGRYSAASQYNSDADLSGALSMTIDGDIYVLKKGGEIIKLYKGSKQNFTIEDLGSDISNVTKIYTASELDNIYLMDPVAKKIVMITKSSRGVSRYYGEIVFEELDSLKGFYVEKNETKLHVLTDKEVFEVDI